MAVSASQLVDEARQAIAEIDVDEAVKRARDGHLVLDVREPGEWEQGHVPEAVHVPRGLLEWKADPAYAGHDPRLAGRFDDPVMVICASGGRSLLAARTLREMGYREVSSIAGGFTEWSNKGLPVQA